MAKGNQTYWQDRQRQLSSSLEKDEAALRKRLAEFYRTEEQRLENEIASYYAKYGVNNVIEYRQLLQNISEPDFRLLMERMEDFAEKYPQYAHLLPVRESIYKLNRLEGLERSVQMQQLEMGIKEQQEVEKHLERQAQRAFKQTVDDLGISNTYGGMDKTIAHDVVMTRWVNGQNFSDRIWADRQKLADTLNDRISAGFARGDQYSKMVKDIRNQFDVSRRNAFRLIYTEGTFVLNESKARAVQETFDYYAFSTVGDEKVCDVCASVQDMTQAAPVRFDQRVTGDNFPPLHPWCRCTFTIVVPDTSKWIDDYVAAHGGDPEVDEEARQEARWLLKRIEAGDTMADGRRTRGAARKSAQPSSNPEVQSIFDEYDVIRRKHSADDDCKAVNPNYARSEQLGDGLFTENCQRCVSAYELRRRGYDVVARHAPMALGEPDDLPFMYKSGGWPSVYEHGGDSLIYCNSDSPDGVRKKVTDMVSDWGDGARGIVRVTWKSGGGHVFNVENEGGTVRFLDPQSGETDCSDHFMSASVDGTWLLRTDDKEFTWRIIQCAYSRLARDDE